MSGDIYLGQRFRSNLAIYATCTSYDSIFAFLLSTGNYTYYISKAWSYSALLT